MGHKILNGASIVTEDGVTTISVTRPDRQYVAHDDQVRFEEIMLGVLNADESVLDLFDLGIVAGAEFEKVSERVSVLNGRVYFDHVEQDNALTKQIMNFMAEGIDFLPLVKFYEKIEQNPNAHSREQLVNWLRSKDFAITEEGDILAYKGVTRDLKSTRSGPGIVNGVMMTGALPNDVGNEISMPRDDVMHDPSVPCASGLHVSSWEYANNFGSKTVSVLVNPRDVVSVPTDYDAEKIRCCRYIVHEVVSDEHEGPLYAYSRSDFYDEEEAAEVEAALEREEEEQRQLEEEEIEEREYEDELQRLIQEEQQRLNQEVNIYPWSQ